jgi:hypothetical protein
VSTQLQRLVLIFSREGPQVRVLYHTEGESGPNTKGRRREVTQLTREGLNAALEGRVDVVGTSGFTTREDNFLCTTKDAARLDEHKTTKKGA